MGKGQRCVFTVDEPSLTMLGRARRMPSTYAFKPNDATDDRSLVMSLTSAHMAALQHFPRGFEWRDTSSVRINQSIGNAVPPDLAEIVARAISRA